MSTPKRTHRAECDPQRVIDALDALVAELLAHDEQCRGDQRSWTVLAEGHRWMANWQTRTARQWSLLGEWAHVTGMPAAVRKAIFLAEHRCTTEALRAEGRATGCQREADRRPVGA